MSHITSYANRLRAFVSARRTHLGLSGRRLRGSLKQLRVTRLLNVEHRGSSHHYTSCSIDGTVRACQGYGSSKGSRRAKIAQAASTAVRVVHARSTRVESNLEACEGCTSFINSGTGSVHQEHRPSLTNSRCVSTKPVQRVQQLPLHVYR